MKTQLTKLEFKILKKISELDDTFKKQELNTVLLNILVSGGKDSMALLFAVHAVLNSNKHRFQCKYIPIATHFNHHKRGQESQQDMYFVQDVCLQLGIECFTYDIKPIDFQSSQNFQNFARQERKRIAQNISASFSLAIKANKYLILTAHHAQDHVESVVMHLLRGSGVHGLQGFYSKQHANFNKLFSDVFLEEILNYIDEKQILHRDDSSNLEDNYDRNYIRNQILPMFSKVNPNYQSNILKCSRHIYTFLQNQAYIPSAEFYFDENANTLRLYEYFKYHFDGEVVDFSENTLNNLYYEANLLQKSKNIKIKKICLPNGKKMTLLKNSEHQVYGTV